MKLIIIAEDSDFETHYQEQLDYLVKKYHTHPSAVQFIPASEAEMVERSCYESLAGQLVSSALPYSQAEAVDLGSAAFTETACQAPIGKLVC